MKCCVLNRVEIVFDKVPIISKVGRLCMWLYPIAHSIFIEFQFRYTCKPFDFGSSKGFPIYYWIYFYFDIHLVIDWIYIYKILLRNQLECVYSFWLLWLLADALEMFSLVDFAMWVNILSKFFYMNTFFGTFEIVWIFESQTAWRTKSVTFGSSNTDMLSTKIRYRVEYFGHGSKKLWPNKQVSMSAPNVTKLMKMIPSYLNAPAINGPKDVENLIMSRRRNC